MILYISTACSKAPILFFFFAGCALICNELFACSLRMNTRLGFLHPDCVAARLELSSEELFVCMYFGYWHRNWFNVKVVTQLAAVCHFLLMHLLYLHGLHNNLFHFIFKEKNQRCITLVIFIRGVAGSISLLFSFLDRKFQLVTGNIRMWSMKGCKRMWKLMQTQSNKRGILGKEC